MVDTISYEGERPPAKAPSRAKRFLILLGVGIAALGATYLGGYFHGRLGWEQLEARLAAEKQAAHANEERLRADLAVERQRVMLLDARRSIDQALAALDARNFGIAEQLIKNAGNSLVAARAEGPLSELAQRLGSHHFVATEDLGTQRAELQRWLTQIDQQIRLPNP